MLVMFVGAAVLVMFGGAAVFKRPRPTAETEREEDGSGAWRIPRKVPDRDPVPSANSTGRHRDPSIPRVIPPIAHLKVTVFFSLLCSIT